MEDQMNPPQVYHNMIYIRICLKCQWQGTLIVGKSSGKLKIKFKKNYIWRRKIGIHKIQNTIYTIKKILKFKKMKQRQLIIYIYDYF